MQKQTQHNNYILIRRHPCGVFILV